MTSTTQSNSGQVVPSSSSNVIGSSTQTVVLTNTNAQSGTTGSMLSVPLGMQLSESSFFHHCSECQYQSINSSTGRYERFESTNIARCESNEYRWWVDTIIKYNTTASYSTDQCIDIQCETIDCKRNWSGTKKLSNLFHETRLTADRLVVLNISLLVEI